eukprot:531800_1
MELDSEFVKLARNVFININGLDTKGTGLIPVAAIRHIMCNLGEQLTDKEVDAMVKETNVDADGNINYEEFLKMMTAQHKALGPFEFEFNQIVSQRKEIANQYANAYDQKIRIIRQHQPEFVTGDKTNKLLNILSHEIFVESNKFDKMWKYVRDIATKKQPLYINIYTQKLYDPLDEFDYFFGVLCHNRLMIKYLMNTPKLYKPFLLFIIQLCKHELLCYSPFGYGTLWSWLMETLRFFKKKHVSYLMKNELC